MKVDIESFEVDFNYVEPVSLPINMVGVNEQEVNERKPQDNTSLDLFKSTEKPIYPKPGENLSDFVLKQRDKSVNIAMRPWCNAIFNRNIAIVYDSQKEAKRANEKQEVEKEIAKKKDERVVLIYLSLLLLLSFLPFSSFSSLLLFMAASFFL